MSVVIESNMTTDIAAAHTEQPTPTMDAEKHNEPNDVAPPATSAASASASPDTATEAPVSHASETSVELITPAIVASATAVAPSFEPPLAAKEPPASVDAPKQASAAPVEAPVVRSEMPAAIPASAPIEASVASSAPEVAAAVPAAPKERRVSVLKTPLPAIFPVHAPVVATVAAAPLPALSSISASVPSPSVAPAPAPASAPAPILATAFVALTPMTTTDHDHHSPALAPDFSSTAPLSPLANADGMVASSGQSSPLEPSSPSGVGGGGAASTSPSAATRPAQPRSRMGVGKPGAFLSHALVLPGMTVIADPIAVPVSPHGTSARSGAATAGSPSIAPIGSSTGGGTGSRRTSIVSSSGRRPSIVRGLSPSLRPVTPSTSRSSPRLPAKAADLLFGSKKHEQDKRMDILGLSPQQMEFIESKAESSKALSTLGVVSNTGSQQLHAHALSMDHSAESSQKQSSLGKTVYHERTHSDSSAAFAAGEKAAQAEKDRLAELERIRSERAAAIAWNKSSAAAAQPRPSLIMTSKAQQLLMGGRGGGGGGGGGGPASASAASERTNNGRPGSAVSPARSLSPCSSARGEGGERIGGNAGTKVLDKLGLTAKQLEHFPNHQSRAFKKLGVDVPLAASMLTDANQQHLKHARADAEAFRAGEEAKEAARVVQDSADHAAKKQNSKKVSALLLGGQDKRNKLLDKLGMTAKELEIYKKQPKAFMKLGLFEPPSSSREAAAAQGGRIPFPAYSPKAASGPQRRLGLGASSLQVPGGRPAAATSPLTSSSLSVSSSASSLQQQPAARPLSVNPALGPRLMGSSKSTPFLASPSGRKMLPSLSGGGPGAGSSTGKKLGSKWGVLKAGSKTPGGKRSSGGPLPIGTVTPPAGTGGGTRGGLATGSTLKPSSSLAGLSRAYGASALSLGGGGTGGSTKKKDNLFSVVMASKKLRGGGLATIQNGKGVPASLGQFALQGAGISSSSSAAAAGDGPPVLKHGASRALGLRSGLPSGSGGTGVRTPVSASPTNASRTGLRQNGSSSNLRGMDGSGGSKRSSGKNNISTTSFSKLSTTVNSATAAFATASAATPASSVPASVARVDDDDDAAYLASQDED